MVNQTFLGTGWSFPPAFSQSGASVALVSGEDDIYQSLQIIFATQTGERLMQDSFGCDLNSVMFEEIDQSLINNITNMITNAILYHEPRIDLNNLDISQSQTESGLLLISLSYTVRGTNSRFNMVYPFYINESINPV